MTVRIAELEAQAAVEHPERPLEWLWLASQEWNDLQHEAGQLRFYRWGVACAIRRERAFLRALLCV